MKLIEIKHGDFVNIDEALRVCVNDNEFYVQRPDRIDKYPLSGNLQEKGLIYHQIKEVQKNG